MAHFCIFVADNRNQYYEEALFNIAVHYVGFQCLCTKVMDRFDRS